MLKPGIYHHSCDKEYSNGESLHMGDIWIKVKESSTMFTLTLLKNTVRYDAPQIEDMFAKSKRVTISKSRSKHALTFSGDKWFCLYPYRVGVPYAFDWCGVPVKENNYGLTYCSVCRAELVCNEYGDMPEVCPHCGEKLSYFEWTEGKNA